MGLDPNILKSSKEELKKKTTLTPMKIKMKKTGRGPVSSSPVAKRVASQRTPIKTPNMKQIVEMLNVKPVHLTAARDFGQVSSFTITKPKKV